MPMLCVFNDAQMYLFLYFQSLFSYSLTDVDCCCTSAISSLFFFSDSHHDDSKKYFDDMTYKTYCSMYFTLFCPWSLWQGYKYRFGDVWRSLSCVIDFLEDLINSSLQVLLTVPLKCCLGLFLFLFHLSY